MKQEWKDIKGYEGIYKVTKYGYIYKCTNRRCVSHIAVKSKVDNGVYYVDLKKGDQKETVDLKYIIAEYFLANPEGKTEVEYINPNKTFINHVDNLRWI